MSTPFVRNLPSSSSYYNRSILSITDFSGGLNNVDDPATIASNQAEDCRNMIFSDNFGMEKRYGISYEFEALEDSDSYNQNIMWYDEFSNNLNGKKYVITASDTKLFIDDKYVCDVNGRVEGIGFNGDYYFVDGCHLHRIVIDNEIESGFKVYKIINDPKYFISSFKSKYIASGGDVDITLYTPFEKTPVEKTEYVTPYPKYISSETYYKKDETAGEFTTVDDANETNFSKYYLKIRRKPTEPYDAKKSYYETYESQTPMTHGTETGNVNKDNYKEYFTDEYQIASMCYSELIDYYADTYGKILIPHGNELGQVNKNNYMNYYVKEIKTVEKDGITLYGFYYNELPINVEEGNVFNFSNEIIGSYNEYDVEAVVDSVTKKTRYTVTTSVEKYPYVITSINKTDKVILFSPAVYDAETESFVASTEYEERRRIYAENMSDIWGMYVDAEPNKKVKYLDDALTEYFGGTLCRCYTPRDKTFNNGEIIITSNDYMWYQPCQNELEYDYLGENYVPSNPRNISTFNGRIWTTGDINQPNEIRACNVDQPCYYPAAISLSMSPNGDVVQDLFEFDGALIIGRKNDIYAVYGNSASGFSDSLFRIKKLDSTTGFISANCGSLINNFYIFLGYDCKFYKLNTPTTNVDYLMIRPVNNNIDLFKEPIKLTRDDIKDLSSVAFNNEIFWHIGDKVISYSYTHQAFTYFTGWDCSCLYTNGLNLFFGGSNGSRYVWNKEVYNDVGNAIDAQYITRTYNNNPAMYKYWEQIMCTFIRPKSASSSIKIYVNFDKKYKTTHLTMPIEMNLTYAKFGSAKWGEDIFSSAPTQKTRWFSLDARSRTISVTFLNDVLDETFKLIDVNIVYTTRDIR